MSTRFESKNLSALLNILPEPEFEFTILNYNIQCDRRNSPGGPFHASHKNWTIEFRLPAIMKFIKFHNPTVVNLFEISADICNDVMIGLRELGYNVVTGAYAANNSGAFHYVTGVAKTCIINKSHMFWFTSTPFDPLSDDTRSSDTVLVENKEAFEKGSLIVDITTPDKAHVLISVNHWPLRFDYQMQCSKMLTNYLAEQIHQDPDIKIVCGGDFNTFPSFEGKCIKNLIDAGFTHHVDPNTKISFIAWPFDLGLVDPAIVRDAIDKIKDMSPLEARKWLVTRVIELHGSPLCSLLDHVFTYGFNPESSMKLLVPDGLDLNNLTPAFIESALNDAPIGGSLSDHFATLTTLYW